MPKTEAFLSPEWFRVRDLRVKLRSHITVHRHRYRGTAWYVIHDELSGRQYRFTPAVYLFIGLMDGLQSQWLYDSEGIDIQRSLTEFLDEVLLADG